MSMRSRQFSGRKILRNQYAAFNLPFDFGTVLTQGIQALTSGQPINLQTLGTIAGNAIGAGQQQQQQTLAQQQQALAQQQQQQQLYNGNPSIYNGQQVAQYPGTSGLSGQPQPQIVYVPVPYPASQQQQQPSYDAMNSGMGMGGGGFYPRLHHCGGWRHGGMGMGYGGGGMGYGGGMGGYPRPSMGFGGAYM